MFAWQLEPMNDKYKRSKGLSETIIYVVLYLWWGTLCWEIIMVLIRDSF